MSTSIDMGSVVEPYKNEWIALHPELNTVVGHGETIELALARAREAGVDDPVLMKAPEEMGTFIL